MAARRMRPDRVSRYFARFRLGFTWLVPRSITSTAPAMRIFPDLAGSKSCCRPEGNFGLVDLDHALQRRALGIDHRSSQLLRQQPGGLVGNAELGLELEGRHAVR